MKLSDLLKVMSKNDIIYYNEREEEGGCIARGNDWDSRIGDKWNVEKVFINSKQNLQCYVSLAQDEKQKPSLGGEMVRRMIAKKKEATS